MTNILKEYPWFTVIMSGFSLGFIFGIAMGIAKHSM